jgi:iron complex transport system substrate-binding protein
VASADVDAVLVAPCGFGLADALDQARRVAHRLPVGVPVWAVDAGAVVTRPGPRVVDGVEALAAAWHPGAGVERPDLVAPAGTGTGPPG